MNHKVNSVQNLYDDAVGLFNNVVTGGANTSADTIISNIMAGIDNLKGCWEGKDAGVQIQNLVVVHNGMVEIRNALGSLAVDSSKIASNYRNIQNANGAGLEELGVLNLEERAKTGDYSDTRDTVSITEEANQGKAKEDVVEETEVEEDDEEKETEDKPNFYEVIEELKKKKQNKDKNLSYSDNSKNNSFILNNR